MSSAQSATSPASLHITDRRWFIRMLEIFPGLMAWTFLIGPIILSIFYPVAVAYFIVAFDLYWVGKALRLSIFLLRGYLKMQETMALDWTARFNWLVDPEGNLERAERRLRDFMQKYPAATHRLHFSREAKTQRRRYEQLVADVDTLRTIIDRRASILDPREIYHVMIIATYNEGREILEPTVESVMESHYDLSKVMLIIAYEERGGEEVAANAKDLIAKYGKTFAHAEAIMHPDGIPGELKGKGANITYAGRRVAELIEERGIPTENVLITTLDSDNKPDHQYLPYLSYVYATNTNRVHKSYQPVPMFLNNIWDAPAPMRVIATGNTFFQFMEMMRPHRLRNFTSHAQPLRALIETDFWSVTSPVEDGHQYWRSYFTFNGDYAVIPLYIAVYQDAVLAETYPKTFLAQYKQLRRWAYGASDFPYVVRNAIRNKQIPLTNRLIQTWRLFEGHFSWATAVLIVTFVAWLPLYLNPHYSHTQELAHQLPIIASHMQQVALIGLVIMISISVLILPPRPERYRRHRNIFMISQWILLPVTGIFFHSFAAIDAQTRLMFGKYLGFYVTTKKRKG